MLYDYFLLINISSLTSVFFFLFYPLRNQLIVGLRKVVVEIEKGNLKSLLLAQEVDPPSLGYLIGNLAEAHNVPFAAVSNLKCCLEELLGFKSWCLGFKVCEKSTLC